MFDFNDVESKKLPVFEKRKIAGHEFERKHTGIWQCCLYACDRLLVDILGANRSDIGKPYSKYYCHTGTLNEKEYLEIETERERMWRAGGQF